MPLQTSLEGKLLLAMPTIRDANFERSVVFLCAHSEQGAMGFVINKPAPLTVFSDLLEKTNLQASEDSIPPDVLSMPIRLGGPVETFRGFVLHSTEYKSDDSSLRIPGGYAVSATVDVLRDIALGQGPERRLITLGYAGWAPGQLEDEIQHNGWLHCDADVALVFDEDLDRKYALAMRKLGVDPSMLSAESGHA
ncbi:MAG: YqgE/AlgH family protein [Proteobacteria bacterium]|nr:YqgE/AlgH family protein [Pseudomonadota bacterium]